MLLVFSRDQHNYIWSVSGHFYDIICQQLLKTNKKIILLNKNIWLSDVRIAQTHDKKLFAVLALWM